ncbi:MAG TPA: hypothetical protein VGD06_09725 [Acidobacteriota bacterium]
MQASRRAATSGSYSAAGLLLALLLWPAPAHAQSGSTSRTGPISGYMELHLNKPVDDDIAPTVLDFHRFVLLVAHRFTERIHFFGELELEHAVVEGLEEGGELELEQAYLDVLATPEVNFRAGMLLVPVGIINERHEPPTFYGVERPFVDTVIIPTTWFEVGAGVHGTLGGTVRYRVYAMAPLDAAEFTAEEGLRGSAQHGVEAQVRSVAWTGRAEYVGIRGLQLGASFWTGNSSVTLQTLDTPTAVIEADARYSRGRFEGRAVYAHAFVDDAAELNDAVFRQTGIDPNVASELRGFYFEGGYRVLPAGFPHDLGLFVRYENFDTQHRMDEGGVPLPQFDRDAWVLGANYWLDPDVVIKLDYSHVRSQSEVVPGPRSLNIGLGWWF